MVVDGFEVRRGDDVTNSQGRQDLLLVGQLSFWIVRTFDVGPAVSGEGDDASVGLELGVLTGERRCAPRHGSRQTHLGTGAPSIGHLGCHGAHPNEFIQAELVP